MATDMISALGAGSGVDVKSLAQSLVDAEKVPREDAINTKIDDQERRIAGYSALMLSLETVKSAFQKLNDATDFNAATVSNSQPAAVGVVTSANATPGRHTVEVQQLASAQKTASNSFASATQQLSGGNAFSIRLNLSGSNQTSIRVANDTPQGVVDAINASEQGVKAQLLNTGDATNPFTIVLTGPMGAAGTFSYSTDDASGVGQVDTLTFQGAINDGTIVVAGVSIAVTAGQTSAEVTEAVRVALIASAEFNQVAGRAIAAGATENTLSLQWSASDGADPSLNYSDIDGTAVAMSVFPASPLVAGNAVSGLTFSGTNLTDAADSIVLVDGLSVTRTSNAVDEVIPGVYLDLLATTVGSPVDVRISRDTGAIKENLQALVQTYNDAISDFAILTGARSDDEGDIYSGSLAGDSTVRRVKQQLQNMFLGDSSTPGVNVSAFRQMGLDLDRTGVMSLDETKLDAALNDNFEDVVMAFSAGTSNQSAFGTASRGIAGDAVVALDALISSRGDIEAQSAGSQERIDAYKVQLETLNTRMESLLARYTKQFGIMESLVGQTNSMRDSLAATFEGMMAMYTNK